MLQQAVDAAHVAVHKSSDTVHSQKAQCEAAPDNPENRRHQRVTEEEDVALAFEGGAASEKVEHPKVSKRHSHHPHHHDHGPHDSKQHD